MQPSVPSVNIVDLNHYWQKAGAMPEEWRPEFYHCGAYDESMDSFPVLRSHRHIIYIPASSKPLCRFLQHTMYALWYLSLGKRFDDQTKANFRGASAYLHHLREAFFDEVREKFYSSTDDVHPMDEDHPMGDDQPTDDDPRQEMPTCTRMTRQWFSSVLFSWGLAIYETHQICPPDSNWKPKALQIDSPASTVFDWASWLTSPDTDALMRALYGSLPNRTKARVDWSHMNHEKSWRRCLRIALKLLEEHLLEDDAETPVKTGAKATARTDPPTPMQMDARPSVPVPSKRSATSAPAGMRKPKKAKVPQSGPKTPGSQQPSNQFSNREKRMGMDKEKSVKSTAPSGCGSQVGSTIPIFYFL
ncbi:hypothetical protein BDR06DRAFT_319234 [Suillus hirtellus]|nr:hypothetical protein BDR06DRAFT_319234 [Suillus hirtellus]